ncbi:2-methyl-3-hydroxypyridine-5-carboxylic acid oxygenase [Streptomyces caatingaensis]|uniref:2-methyl-3-hydroxypyridine-5-carboxylic acid oxygenase n=1 Tax=Streptomyces caatingaensis TaxID=1678637 RepID=A0A0K9XB96_9ACTN|nr:2-methyl-3-hydroxypyridine-5-carboxylic acid oxygenase [Streptomyces caatingaensis]
MAGAGFAGLTLAAELARRGWRVRVHERAPEPRAFGAGIFLWENGLRVLAELGALDAVLADSHEAPHWQERDSDGALIGTRPLPLPGGLRMITLTRQTLHTALHEAARAHGAEIVAGSRVLGAHPDGALRTEDGWIHAADLVAGADGIRSAVRTALGLDGEHREFPVGLYRFLVPLDRAPGTDGQWRDYVNYWNTELSRRVLYVPCDSRHLYLLISAVDGDAALRAPLDPRVWCESFPVLGPLLAHLPAHPRFDRYELIRPARWSAGSAALIGDAAHAMPPTIGQGAGTAMLNALDLARAVADAADVPAALRAWETANRPATERTQDESLTALRGLFPRTGERRDEAWTEGTLSAARAVPSNGQQGEPG